jgi:membrane protein
MQPLLRLAAKWLWPDAEPVNPHTRRLLSVGRYLFALIRELATGELSLRAMSLVYTTMLATVPALGFAFALAKGLGLLVGLQDLLLTALQPLGESAAEIADLVNDFVDNVSGPLLGTLSVGILLLTVISMAQKVESSFNFVWRVDRPRSFGRRFSEYLSAILIGPLVMLIAVSLIASLQSVTLVARLRESYPLIDSWLTGLVPFVLTIFAFTFLYVLIPNTRVRLRPALIGGIAAGIVWTGSGYLLTKLVTASSRYDALYSGFAIVLILMFWLYLSWLILLLGSQLAFYIQNPYRLRFGQRTEPIDNDARERLSLAVMYLVARDFAEPAHGWTDESLAAELSVPREALEPIMTGLRADQLIGTSEQRLIPGRDPHRIRLIEIIAAVRGDGRAWMQQRQSWSEAVDQIGDRIDEAIEVELGQKTLGQLVDEALGQKAD